MNVNAAKILRKGTVSSARLWYYNGAITSDRVLNANTQAYGGGYAIGFDSSSAAQPLRIQTTSQSASCQVYGYCRGATMPPRVRIPPRR